MSCRCRVAASAYFINASPSVQVPSAPRPYSSLFCSSAHPPAHLLPPLAIHMHHLSPFSSICICCHATTSPAIGDISICDCSISLGPQGSPRISLYSLVLFRSKLKSVFDVCLVNNLSNFKKFKKAILKAIRDTKTRKRKRVQNVTLV